ncbi:MAG: hypothetical protein ACRD2J_02060 [Thermoanaerobaculia bacterium]
MKRPLVLVLILAAFTAAAAGWWYWAEVAGPRPPRRVVYAAPLDAPETASFVRMLREHFPQVRTIPVTSLATADLSQDDVLIVGGSYKEDRPRGLSLDALSIPTVLIGGMGGRISDDLDLKLGWRYG